VELDIAVLTGGDGRLKGQRDLSIYVARLGYGQTGRSRSVHIRRVELGHYNGVGPGRVGDGQPEDAIFKTGPGVDRGKPVKRLVPLLVGIAVSPVDRLFLYFYRPGLYLQPLGLAEALACYQGGFTPQVVSEPSPGVPGAWLLIAISRRT
jgi:hypothetical protein